MDENADGGVVTSVATENATSVTVDDERFEVADGNLKLTAGTTLDFETDTSPIEVTITASGEGDSATRTVSVSINDVNEEPSVTITAGATVPNEDMTVSSSTVAENAMGSSVPPLALIEIADPDAADATMGADAVAMVTLSGDHADNFEVKLDPEDGLWLALKGDASLDFEGSGGTITVTVTYTDTAGNTASADATVTVTDVNEGPSLEAADGAVDENADGATVGAVTASDPDAGDTHTYEVSDSRFEVADGMLKLKDGMMLDHETEDSVMVKITVTDSGDLSASADVTVTVNDVNEAAEVDGEVAVPNAVFVAGAENSVDVDLGALFTDPDGDTLTYSLSDNAPDWLELSVTTSGSTITGTLSGTPPAGDDAAVDGVSIIATDDGGESSEAMFDVVVDDENDAPTSLRLAVPEDDLLVTTTEVDVKENAPGAELGTVIVRDPDDDRHPHGMHEFSFMVDGEADDRFEVTDDGKLKLKDGVSLDYEAGDTIVLTITAKDMYVTAPGEDEEDTRETISRDITITVKDVATGDGPVLVKGGIGDWWVTVDDRLDAEDAREGEWLSFGLKTTGENAAFTDEGTMTYSVTVKDSSGNDVDWLQIDPDTGAMTNKAGMVPGRADVYTVTVTATDNDDNETSDSFKLAVAIGDLDDSDNDRPDIRDVTDHDYEEGSGAQRVVSFEVRDDDIAIAPHPYGTLEVEFTAMQGSTNVTDRFKLVEKGNTGDDTANYEIHHKSDDELFVMEKKEDGTYGYKLDAEDKKIPIKPIDYEMGDEVEFSITATDGKGETDDQTVRVDIEDAADAAPRFAAPDTAKGRDAPSLKNKMVGTTTFEVDQQDDDVIVLRLSDVWSDPDTDVDELDFTVSGKGGLPDWVKVYGPDEWEDIYTRRDDVERGDAPSGLRDRDLAIAIVIDHSAATDDPETTDVNELAPGKALGSFKLTASDPDGNETTETISIDVKDINVSIPTTSNDDVVTITGDPDGTGSLEMVFDEDLDPDFAAGGNPVLVLYTWSHDNGTPTVDTDDVIISVSTTPQPLPLLVLDATTGRPTVTAGNVERAYTTDGDATLTHTITAKVEYYEVNPDGTISVVSHDADVEVAADTTATPRDVPFVSTTPTSVRFDVITTTTGASVTVHSTGDATGGSYRWQKSDDGSSFTSVGTANAALSVDADGDGTTGDGGGSYYRVSYTYQDADGNDVTVTSDEIQLGNVTASAGNGDPDSGNNALLGGTGATTPAAVGTNLRADTQGNPATVQWQMWVDANRDNTRDANEWMDIEGDSDGTLTVSNDHVGSALRAKVTYTHENNPATPAVDESSWVRWVEYTVEQQGPAAATNAVPSRTQATHEIRVNITQTTDSMGVTTNHDGSASDDSVSGLFHDSDGDTLTYNLLGTTPATNLQSGNRVYREVFDRDSDPTTDEGYQVLAIDSETGEITYYTSNAVQHGSNTTDGAGNTLVVNVNANDGRADSANDLTVTVRVNVSPTAIWAGAAAPASLADTDALGMAVDAMGKPTDATDLSSVISIDETAGVTKAQAAALAPINVNVQDLNSSSDDFGTHKISVSDSRFEVVPTGGGRRDTDSDGSTWELRVKEGAKFDYEAKANPMGVVTVKVTATDMDGDKDGHKVVGYFTIQINDVTDATDTKTGNKNTGDPQYAPEEEEEETLPAEDPETPGLKDDSDDSDEDGAVPPEEDEGPEMPGGMGMFIDDLIDLHVQDDMLDAFVLAIDDIDIA